MNFGPSPAGWNAGFRARWLWARGAGAKRRNGYEEYVVPAEGFEPPLPEGKRILSPLRLPVPPRPHDPSYTP